MRILTNSKYMENAVYAVLTKFFGPLNFDGFANGHRRADTKGDEMEHDYINLYQTIGISKNNIYLIDDSEENCLHAEEHGFKAIRMGTNPKMRGNTTYSLRKEQIFQSLHEIVENASSKHRALNEAGQP